MASFESDEKFTNSHGYVYLSAHSNRCQYTKFS